MVLKISKSSRSSFVFSSSVSDDIDGVNEGESDVKNMVDSVGCCVGFNVGWKNIVGDNVGSEYKLSNMHECDDRFHGV